VEPTGESTRVLRAPRSGVTTSVGCDPRCYQCTARAWHCRVSASKPGYLDGGHSAANLPGTTSQLIALDDGEWVSGIRVELWKPGVIAGRVRDLPAGRYLIGALTDFEPEDLEDPAFLQQLAAQAVPVVIRDGERTVQSLRIAR
jgi:hypothetical protein